MITLIQARSTSTRLPDKISKDLHGETLLERCVHACQPASPVVVIFPFGDDICRAHCINHNWQYREGPETDVLTRYISAVMAYPEEHYFARVTSDCSLISTSELMYMRHIASMGFDFVSNCVIDPREGMEIEVLSRKAWLWLDKAAKGNGYREHCTTYIKEHMDEFTKAHFNAHYHREPYLSEWLPKHLSIDTQQDYKIVKEIWKKWTSYSDQ